MSYAWLSNLNLWPLLASIAIAITCVWLSDLHSNKE